MPKVTRDAMSRLADIEASISRIRRYTASLSGFGDDMRTFDAVVMNIIVIGEAVNHLPDWLKQSEAGVPWREIVSARNLVAHGYPELEPDVIWAIASTRLDPLEAAVQRMKVALSG